MLSTAHVTRDRARRALILLVAATLVSGLVAGIMTQASAAPSLPDGFSERALFSGLEAPTSFAVAPDGRVFVGEKSGIIKVFPSLTDPTPTVFADLRVDTYNEWDRGLVGIAVDPQLLAGRPYVYVSYSYDHALGDPAPAPKWGAPNPVASTFDPCPDPPGPTTDGCVTSARVVRLTISGGGGGSTMTAQKVLVEDWCMQFPSHTIGAVKVGTDGALYVSGGDGGSFSGVDYGQFGAPQKNPCGDPPGGVNGSMTPPTARGGTLRAQSPRRPAGEAVSLDGTMIRINADTGAGLPGNPQFGSADPNRARVLGYGFKNPYRWTFRPGTNEIWVGDVGLEEWEEIDRIVNPAALTNFGFPCYEGANPKATYQAAGLDVCDTLYASGTATPPHWAYAHSNDVAPGDAGRCPPGAPLGGEVSSAITGLTFYGGGTYPAKYTDALFFADYARECIWAMLPGPDGIPSPERVETFYTGAATPVDLQTDPVSGDLLYLDIGRTGSLRRISYEGGPGAYPPVARMTTNPASASGAVPLSVAFDATTSSDPQGGALQYTWNFGDGATSTSPTVTHTYSAAGKFEVRLTVVNAIGLAGTTRATVSAGGPVPTIATPATTLRFGVGDDITYSGSAVNAAGQALPASALSWRIAIRHCSQPTLCHDHQLGAANGVANGTIPAPDHELPSYVSIRLTATDAAGLQTTVTRDVFPDVARLRLVTSPPGLEVATGSAAHGPAPLDHDVIRGAQTTVSALPLQAHNGKLYRFATWSDGGAATHTVSVPGAMTLTATYSEVASAEVPAPTAGGWNLNGAAAMSGQELVLTPAGTTFLAGSAFFPTPVGSNAVSAAFDFTIGGGSGSDGLTFVLADPAAGADALGGVGFAMGFGGLSGVAVTADTWENTGDPSNNFVGVATGVAGDHLVYAATSSTVPPLRDGAHRIAVTVDSGALTASIDGQVVLANIPVDLPDDVLVGFSAATGGLTDRHAVSNVAIAAAPASTAPPPGVVVPSPVSGGWSVNGSAVVSGQELVLTPAGTTFLAGSAFYPTAVSSGSVSAAFDVKIGPGSGADGLTFVLADPTSGPQALGGSGWKMGFGGIPGVAVTADTYKNSSDPSNNFVGVATGQGGDALTYVATSASAPPLRVGTHRFVVTVSGGSLSVKVDGATLIAPRAVTLPDEVLVGFSAATGGLADRHAISNVTITSGGTAPPPGVVVPSPVSGGWSVNGSAVVSGQELVLTPAGTTFLAGSAFYPAAVSSGSVSAAFDVTIGPGSGADGLTFVLADPAAGPQALGGSGWKMGFGGIPGVAVTADTYKNSSDPSNNFVGVATGQGLDALTYLATSASAPPLRLGTHRFVVTVAGGSLSVKVNGATVIAPRAVALPDEVLVGFSAATGGLADRHAISNVTITTDSEIAPVAFRSAARREITTTTIAAAARVGRLHEAAFCPLVPKSRGRLAMAA